MDPLLCSGSSLMRVDISLPYTVSSALSLRVSPGKWSLQLNRSFLDKNFKNTQFWCGLILPMILSGYDSNYIFRLLLIQWSRCTLPWLLTCCSVHVEWICVQLKTLLLILQYSTEVLELFFTVQMKIHRTGTGVLSCSLILIMKVILWYLCLFWTQKRLATRSGVSPCLRTKNVKSVFPEFPRLVNCSCCSVVILSSLISLVLISNCWLKFASHFCQIWSSLVGFELDFSLE